MDEWIDVNDRLPSDMSWVEVKWKPILPEIIEWFYWTGGSAPEIWPNGQVTHWRYITSEFFKPIIEIGFILSLPIEGE